MSHSLAHAGVLAELRAFLARRVQAERLALAWPRAARWTQPNPYLLDGQPIQLVLLHSPLAVREWLLEPAQEPCQVALVSCEERELGDDVLARLYRQRLHPLRPLQQLRELLGLPIDPLLARQQVLVELLLQLFASASPTVPGHVLGEAVAWDLLLRHFLDWPGLPVHLAALLELLEPLDQVAPTAAARLRAAPPALRQALEDKLLHSLGPAAALLLRAVIADYCPALALGLVCDPLTAPALAADPVALRALARLESKLEPARPLDPVQLRALADQTVALVLARRDQPASHQALAAADELLERLDAAGCVRHARLSPRRIQRHCADLAELFAAPSATAWADLAERCALDHPLLSPDLAAALEALAQLARDLAQPDPAAPDLLRAARAYRDRGAVLDLARARLRACADPELSRAAAAPLAAMAARREAQNQRFAALLADAPADLAAPDLIPHECLLDQLVGREQSPRLLIVLVDGLSLADAQGLVPDLKERGWSLDKSCLGLAVLPTVTQNARASLWSGKRVQGQAAEERRGFERWLKGRGLRGRLLGKDELMDGQGLSAQARVAMESREELIGVIINAVDDGLAAGWQEYRDWRLERMPVLAQLLAKASQQRRKVIVTSDHGHVLEWETRYSKAEGGGERWRPASGGEAGEGERHFKGARVMEEGGAILATTERLRYTPKKKQGYHGGATLQEVLTPIWTLTFT